MVGMRSTSWGCAALLIALLHVPATTAGELRLGQLPADTRWVAHVNVEAIKDAPLARQIVAAAWQREPARVELGGIAQVLGIDPGEDIFEVTFLGRNFDPEKGAVIVRARLKRDQLVALLRMRDDYTREEYHDHELHRWKDDESGDRLTGCFAAEDLVVFGKDRETVVAVLDVLDGRAERWEYSEPADRMAHPAGTIVQVWVQGLDDLKVPFMSPLVRRTERLAIMIGEHQEAVFIEGMIRVESATTAGDVHDALRGIVALAKLQFGDDEQLVALLDLAQFRIAGCTVLGTWRCPTEQLGQVLGSRIPQRWQPSDNGSDSGWGESP